MPPTATRKAALERMREMLTTRGSSFTASMPRDLVAGGRAEGDHIIGNLLRRAERRGVDDVALPHRARPEPQGAARLTRSPCVWDMSH